MTKTLKSIVLLFVVILVMITVGCDNGLIGEYDQTQMAAPATKEEASEQLSLAREAFYDRIETTSRSVSDLPEGVSLKDYITGLAMDACSGNDNSELISFLEDNGLKEAFDAVLIEYNAEACQEILAQPSVAGSRSISTGTAAAQPYGAIFMWYGSDPLSEILISGHWKHSALRCDATHEIINAGKNGMSGSGNGINYYTYLNQFGTCTTSVWWISGASSSKGVGAVNYAKSQLYEPYNFMAAHDDTTEWYCTKLAWRAWLSQGYDIEDDNWDFWNYHILAQAMAEDNNTYRRAGDSW